MPLPLPAEKKQQWEKGLLVDAHSFLGAHMKKDGAHFGVWAPHARQVQVAGDFNHWQPHQNPMTRVAESEFWSAHIPEAASGQRYKFAVTGPAGHTTLKADPYAFFAEQGSHHASILYAFPDFDWTDEDWLRARKQHHQTAHPLAAYEVHLGSWRHDENGNVLSYRQLADRLVPYVKEMGFTHIELMPVMEHPYGPSWGYQVTGFYAPTARYGRPEDFMAFVDVCHRHGIGVIMDWVPGHFPRDEHGLRFFDGTPLYEHADERRREHPDWGTHNFDFEKAGVRNFLLSNLFFWADKYHIDAFRFDAVASMLYLDYSKNEGEWLPNKFGGNQNLEAIAFLQDLNRLAGTELQGVLTIAEESTSWEGVTRSSDEGGLGFDYKWNMGWMNDTLHYFSLPPQQRLHENHSITFPRTYAFSERFILPFSHDEVVHLKKSLWSKMPGSEAEKFAQLRSLYLYMIGCPGKKLLFMGSELAVRDEWSENKSIPWELLENKAHKDIQDYLKSLLHLYRSEPVLYRTDQDENSFSWVDISRKEEGIFSFSRQGEMDDEKLLFVFNFSDMPVPAYQPDVSREQSFSCIFESTTDNKQRRVSPENDSLHLEPFQGLVLKPTRF